MIITMNIFVVDYDPQWDIKYTEESEKIKDVLGDELVEIHHIGSTAVAGLKAKPIIDMMPVVKDINKVDDFNKLFIALGYEPMGELGISGRRYFRKGGDNRTHQIHIFQQGNDHHIIRHLAVRDYLRQHPETVWEYGDLKTKLATLYPKDIDGYCDGKDSFMQKLETEALIWFASQS